MRKIILIILILLLPKVTNADSRLENIDIEIKGANISLMSLYKNINNTFDLNWGNDFIKKENAYKKLLSEIEKIYSKNKSDKILKLKILFTYGLQESKKFRENYFLKVHKIKIGVSEEGRDIFAYYKGDPQEGFFGIFSNIHGGYEYGTYNTAMYLIEEFEKSGKTGWFIIPTINPDGLEYYLQNGKKYSAYLEGRVNTNNIDLNRNFCTKNFILSEFIKNGYKIGTGLNGCNSEKEVKAIIETLKDFKFNKIISLHSKGKIIFIPDNSFDDHRIINFGNEIASILPGYNFDTSYSNDFSKKQKIIEYEINEGGISDFTGTMETYIYEKYNVPTILIELEEHGKIEYNLKNLKNFLKD